MKLPRDVSGSTLLAALRRMGYEKVRQRGSHVRITTQEGGENHEVIPLHDPIRAKTLSSILKGSVANNSMVQSLAMNWFLASYRKTVFEHGYRLG